MGTSGSTRIKQNTNQNVGLSSGKHFPTLTRTGHHYAGSSPLHFGGKVSGSLRKAFFVLRWMDELLPGSNKYFVLGVNWDGARPRHGSPTWKSPESSAELSNGKSSHHLRPCASTQVTQNNTYYEGHTVVVGLEHEEITRRTLPKASSPRPPLTPHPPSHPKSHSNFGQALTLVTVLTNHHFHQHLLTAICHKKTTKKTITSTVMLSLPATN